MSAAAAEAAETKPRTLEPTPEAPKPSTWLPWLGRGALRFGGALGAGQILLDPSVTGEQKRESFALDSDADIRLNHGGPERSGQSARALA